MTLITNYRKPNDILGTLVGKSVMSEHPIQWRVVRPTAVALYYAVTVHTACAPECDLRLLPLFPSHLPYSLQGNSMIQKAYIIIPYM